MVIVIIGVLSTIAVPIYSNHIVNAKINAAIATIKAEYNKAVVSATQNNTYLSETRIYIDFDNMLTKARYPEGVSIVINPNHPDLYIHVNFKNKEKILWFDDSTQYFRINGAGISRGTTYIAGSDEKLVKQEAAAS